MEIVFGITLIVLAWFDVRRQHVPLEPVLALLIIGLIGRAFDGDAPTAFLGMMIGGGFLGAQFVLSRGRWIGSGDVWLGLAMGAWLGWWGMLVALYAAYIGGGIIALILLVCGIWKRGQRVPFVPFLALGGIVAVAVGYWG